MTLSKKKKRGEGGKELFNPCGKERERKKGNTLRGTLFHILGTRKRLRHSAPGGGEKKRGQYNH